MVGASFTMRAKFDGTPQGGVNHHLSQSFQVFDSSGNSLFTMGPSTSVDLPDNDYHEWKKITFSTPRDTSQG